MIFALTFLTTIFYSVDVGISIGCVYSIISIIKRSAKSRIQILAKVEGIDHFVNADEYQRYYDSFNPTDNLNMEHFEDCLVVKIPEPLTFSNTEDLKERLDRLERFGSVYTHPGQKDIRTRGTIKYVIIDLKGMTFVDSSAVQILEEIIDDYNSRNVKVLLTRVPLKREVRFRLLKSGITDRIVNYNSVNKTASNSTSSQQGQIEATLINDPFFPSIEEAMYVVESGNA